VGSFYAKGISVGEMLRAYASRFDTVEVDDTFRGIPPESLLHIWGESVPQGFCFALKVPQQVTHERRFADSGRFLKRFLDRVSLLGDRLGPLVILMPPGLPAVSDTTARFTDFVLSLPSEMRWAVEFRSRGWLTPEVLGLLQNRGIAVVWSENRWLPRSCVLDLTREPGANFAYIRWNPAARHGKNEMAREESVDAVTTVWPDVVRGVRARVHTVYGYMGSSSKGVAPEDLRRFEEALHGSLEHRLDMPQSARNT